MEQYLYKTQFTLTCSLMHGTLSAHNKIYWQNDLHTAKLTSMFKCTDETLSAHCKIDQHVQVHWRNTFCTLQNWPACSRALTKHFLHTAKLTSMFKCTDETLSAHSKIDQHVQVHWRNTFCTQQNGPTCSTHVLHTEKLTNMCSTHSAHREIDQHVQHTFCTQRN